jgi:hypothetical protein
MVWRVRKASWLRIRSILVWRGYWYIGSHSMSSSIGGSSRYSPWCRVSVILVSQVVVRVLLWDICSEDVSSSLIENILRSLLLIDCGRCLILAYVFSRIDTGWASPGLMKGSWNLIWMIVSLKVLIVLISNAFEMLSRIKYLLKGRYLVITKLDWCSLV